MRVLKLGALGSCKKKIKMTIEEGGGGCISSAECTLLGYGGCEVPYWFMYVVLPGYLLFAALFA